MQDKSRGAAPDQKAAPSAEARRGRHARPDSDGDGRAGPFAAELEALRKDLDERTRDLQRLTAEYANYRRRVDRDRALVAEQAAGAVLSELLGVLDDVDRARAHGDLVGPFGAVADQLISVLSKFGLSAFGEAGDQFDPSRHEAVAHSLSSEVSEPTCVEVFRRGYSLGERLLRPALVAVADPAGDEPEPAEAKPAEAKPGEAKVGAAPVGNETTEKAEAEDAEDADAEAVEADAMEAEAVEGEIVDPEAAAVAESESDAAEAEEPSDEADEADQPAAASDAEEPETEEPETEEPETEEPDADETEAEESETGDAENPDAEVVEGEVVEGEVVDGEVVEDRGDAEAEERTAGDAGKGDGAEGADDAQPDGDQGRK